MCFYSNHSQLYQSIRSACESRGYRALVPVDSLSADKPPLTHYQIFRNNILMIDSCDCVLANLTSFIGQECDSGTVFEIGYAFAKKKPIVAFFEDERSIFNDRCGSHVDKTATLEDFGLSHKLMLWNACDNIVHGSANDALNYCSTLLN